MHTEERVTAPAPDATAAGPASPVRASLVLPRRPFEARLLALLTWLEEIVGYEQAFVIDSQGLPLVERRAAAELVAASAALGRAWQALRRSGELDEHASVALDLGSPGPGPLERLHLLAAETRWGLLQLGLVTGDALGRYARDAAREAFRRTVDEKEHDRS